LGKDRHPSECAGERLLSNAHLLDAREASAFLPAPVGGFLRVLALSLFDLAEKNLTAKVASNGREGREELIPRPRGPGIPVGSRRSETGTHY